MLLRPGANRVPSAAETIVETWVRARELGVGVAGFNVRDLFVVIDALQQQKLTLATEQLVAVLENAQHCSPPTLPSPLLEVLVAAAEGPLTRERPQSLVEPLERWRDALHGIGFDYYPHAKPLIDHLDRALRGVGPLAVSGTGRFGRRIAADLEQQGLLPPVLSAWNSLLEHCLATGSGKLSARWRKIAEPLLDALGREVVVVQLLEWLNLGPCPGAAGQTRATAHDADLIKGLSFSAAVLGDARLAPGLANMSAACLRKIANIGPASARAGNACIQMLAELPAGTAVAQLGRVRAGVKYVTPKRLVKQSVDAAAERAGVSAAELEDRSVPTYGLDARGVSRVQLGNVSAEIAISNDRVTLAFRAANGRAARSPSAALRRDHAAELRALRRTKQEIAQLLPAQRVRLEQLMLTRRVLTVERGRGCYWAHPLLGAMARSLIWVMAFGGTTKSAMLTEGRWVDAQGDSFDVPEDAAIHLFHPLDRAPDEILAWRRRLENGGITQPFKQAHREVYLLTDAERATDTYSNRFAGHILRQHQLAALCRDRGWHYDLQGSGFDSANDPQLRFPGTDLKVELRTEQLGRDAEASTQGVDLYISTDQVRFFEGDRLLPLERVPELVFSEVLRDIDLFVSVASIGTDPNWIDQGAPPPYGAYWQEFASAELSRYAATRRAVLEAILPKLKIAERCSLDQRHLVVRGELATYRIHLGSGNVLLEPGSRYLCILQQRGAGQQVALPFQGDGMLAMILSKAFLLAADHEITDPAILRQLPARS